MSASLFASLTLIVPKLAIYGTVADTNGAAMQDETVTVTHIEKRDLGIAPGNAAAEA